jgi:hypothetical protein
MNYQDWLEVHVRMPVWHTVWGTLRWGVYNSMRETLEKSEQWSVRSHVYTTVCTTVQGALWFSIRDSIEAASTL